MAKYYTQVGRGTRMTLDKKLMIFRVDGAVFCDGPHNDWTAGWNNTSRRRECPGKQPHPKTYYIIYRVKLFDPDNLKRGIVDTFNNWPMCVEWLKEYARSNLN